MPREEAAYDPSKHLQVDPNTINARFDLENLPVFFLKFEPVEGLEDWQWELERRQRIYLLYGLISMLGAWNAAMTRDGDEPPDPDVMDEFVERSGALVALLGRVTGADKEEW